MIDWLKDIKINDIAEWITILSVGFVAIFRMGKFSTAIARDRKDIEGLLALANQVLLPDDPINKIIRQSDLNQLEKLLMAHEERLKMFIELRVGKG